MQGLWVKHLNNETKNSYYDVRVVDDGRSAYMWAEDIVISLHTASWFW